MKLLKNTFVLAVVAFWALMTNHCGLELISGLEFLACSPQAEATPHQPTDCGDENDACATVESGLYKSEPSEISAGKAFFPAVALAVALLSQTDAPEPSADQFLFRCSPPELLKTWQFSFRTALPARAPSLLS